MFLGRRVAAQTGGSSGKGTLAYSGLVLVILLAALFLRVYRLSEVPAGVDYDESGNFIFAQEISTGQTRPVFIRAYAGREAVFYWLAAASMRLFGHSLFAFRLAAASCGVGTVLFAYALAREMFRDEPALERRWIPLIAAALIAVSYWNVHVSRYGFRVNAMTLFVAAMMTFLWRGLRRHSWLDLAVAGTLCGLAANTYLAIRAFPLVLLFYVLWVTLTWRHGGVRNWRWLRVASFPPPGSPGAHALSVDPGLATGDDDPQHLWRARRTPSPAQCGHDPGGLLPASVGAGSRHPGCQVGIDTHQEPCPAVRHAPVDRRTARDRRAGRRRRPDRAPAL